MATSLKLSKKLSKVGVVVGNCFGFVANCMLGYCMNSDARGIAADRWRIWIRWAWRNVLDKVNEYRARLGDHWQPAPLLERVAAAGKGFYDE